MSTSRPTAFGTPVAGAPRPTPVPEPLPQLEPIRGATLAGRWRVESRLGGGGMGVVLAATDLATSRRVAVKVLSAGAGVPGALARFRREIAIVQRLRGEHVVRALDAGVLEDGHPFLVMELLEGRDYAAELAARGALDPQDAVDDLLQVCEGVAEAHAAGLGHCDLKPANVFVTAHAGARVLKVLDFGISRSLRSRRAVPTPSGLSIGSPRYMSPEQHLARAVDPRSDQHALATILFEAIVGASPHGLGQGLSRVIVGEAPVRLCTIRRDAPRGLEAVLARALAKRPDARFTDVAELAWALTPFGGRGARAAAMRVEATLQQSAPAEADDAFASSR